ncbi:porin [Agarivorans sp. QJM3NY_33]|uniref:porin n=1 Tax=Agarivorans sp. QJM3NY_33 TaxID=3421432 RepID=UPI003D7C7994
MKKTILAVAIPALFAASAQAANVYDADGVSADVYGRMQFDIRDEQNKDANDNLLDGTDTNGVGSARMGFNARSEIAPGIAGVAKGEWQIAAENSDDSKFKARHLYAGFDFDDAGTVVFGQTDTAFYKSVEATDVWNSYGYSAFNYVEDGRQEGQIIYNGEFGGFYVGASYQFKDDAFTVDLGTPNNSNEVTTAAKLDSSYATTIGYNFADLGLAVYGGYHKEKFANADKENYALSAAYTLNDLYLGAVYAATDLEGAKLQGYDLVATYDIDAVKLFGGYTAQEAKGSISAQGDTVDEFTLGVQYSFNSNMKTWAEYKADSIDGKEDLWTIAVQYNF